MTKKIISVLLAVCILCVCLLPAAAVNDIGVISVRLNSDIAGLTQKDAERFIELRSGNVVFKTENGGPVFVSDYSGTADDGVLVAGRTYFVDYSMVAADGFTLPETLDEGDVQIECGKGVSVIATQIVTTRIRNEDGDFEQFLGLRIYAKVVVDGNVFQRFIGMIHDLVLKIKAWSLY